MDFSNTVSLPCAESTEITIEHLLSPQFVKDNRIAPAGFPNGNIQEDHSCMRCFSQGIVAKLRSRAKILFLSAEFSISIWASTD
jgi:hypothetical protein